LLFAASYISNFFIGYGYRMFSREERVRFLILSLFFLQSIFLNLTYMYVHGLAVGAALSSQRSVDFYPPGFASIKASIFH
jgi:hypothetical protein